jgi:Alpha-glutamyl/putrescinyl thymine pyrophosphorylase clade 3
MWPTRRKRLSQLENGLQAFSKKDTVLEGIASDEARATLTMQMIASLRRLEYTAILKRRSIGAIRTDPNNNLFDPERAALFHAANGNVDEAIWLVFLSIHFGKHGRHGWRMVRDVYSGIGTAFPKTRMPFDNG